MEEKLKELSQKFLELILLSKWFWRNPSINLWKSNFWAILSEISEERFIELFLRISWRNLKSSFGWISGRNLPEYWSNPYTNVSMIPGTCLEKCLEDFPEEFLEKSKKEFQEFPPEIWMYFSNNSTGESSEKFINVCPQRNFLETLRRLL